MDQKLNLLYGILDTINIQNYEIEINKIMYVFSVFDK